MMMKDTLLKSAEPVVVPVTRLVMKKHYQNSQKLTDVVPNQNVLVLAPHMDDETIGLGGTIRRHANTGSKVTCLFITDGGQSVSRLPGEELSTVRKAEINQIQPILGINQVSYCDLPDGHVRDRPELSGIIAEHIQRLQPDIIYATTFVDAHPDHVATAEALADSLEQVDNVDPVIRLYEINCPFPPAAINCLIDISETLPAKHQAIDVFQSQAIAFDGFLELNRMKAHLAENAIDAAEGFLQLSSREFQKIIEAVRKEPYDYPRLFKQANRTVTLLWAIYKNNRLKKRIYQQHLPSHPGIHR
ncbi:PIG-L deacetylase family protein [Sediminibacillus halophilus]|uniref:N-acetylglucosaminyl deacetylase, LmbE family n=1 Tax=Sediminibacillus halophilus TaxID=482461 RepID=A0A1G9U403_9BACI|nr:PIG-L family deacetylase [Sediminibacillus halophilus]SDM54677.1 N-acetylglucosaminyl deacetylase, LmbE family [Sediminibacillus halophilus]